MSHVNDLIRAALEALGYSGSVDNMRLARFKSDGATSDNPMDAQKEWLVIQGATPGQHVDDMWKEVLLAAGYSGHINNMYYDFWSDGGTLAGTPAVITSAVVADANPDQIVLTFNKVITSSDFAVGLTVALNASPVTNLAEITTGSGSSITLDFDETVSYGDVLTVSYNATTGDYVDSDTLDVETFSAYAVTNNVAPTTLAITSQPSNDSVTEPTAGSFSITAVGQGTLSYQWYREGSPVGTDSSTYNTGATNNDNTGDEVYCVVSDDLTSLQSNTVTLTIAAEAPTITVQPSNDSVTEPDTGNFSITATGEGTLTYQWYKNTVLISGATSSSYETPATDSADTGDEFYCIVTDDFGSTQSDTVTLTIAAAGAFALTAAEILSSGSGDSLKLTFNANVQAGSGVATVKAMKAFGSSLSYRPIISVGTPSISTNTATFTLYSNKPVVAGETGVVVDIPSGLIERASDSQTISASNDNAVTNNSSRTYAPICQIVSQWGHDETGTYTAEANAFGMFGDGISKVVFTAYDGTTTLTSSDITARDVSTYDDWPVYQADFNLSLLDDGAVTITATAHWASGGSTRAKSQVIYNNDGGSLSRPVYYAATTGNNTTGNGTSGNPYRDMDRCFTLAQANGDGSCIVELMDDGDYPGTGAGSGTYSPSRPPIVRRGSGTTKAGVRLVDDGGSTIRTNVSGHPVFFEDITIYTGRLSNSELLSKINFPAHFFDCTLTMGQPSPSLSDGNTAFVSAAAVSNLSAWGCHVEDSTNCFPFFYSVRNCTTLNTRSDLLVNVTGFAMNIRCKNRGLGREAFSIQYTGAGTGTVSSSGYAPSQKLNLYVDGGLDTAITLTGSGSGGMSVSDMVSAINAVTDWSATLIDGAINLGQQTFAFFDQTNCDSPLTIYNANSDHSDLIQIYTDVSNVIYDGISCSHEDLTLKPGLTNDNQVFWLDYTPTWEADGLAVINISDPTYVVGGVTRSGMHCTLKDTYFGFISTPYTPLNAINSGGAANFLPDNTMFVGNILNDMEEESSAPTDETYIIDQHWRVSSGTISGSEVLGHYSTGDPTAEFSDEGFNVYTLTPSASSNIEDVAADLGDFYDCFGKLRTDANSAIGAQRGSTETGTYPSESSDVTAPTISGVSVGTITSVGAILTFTSDEAGTAYWMVDTNATRTAAQVKSGGGVDSDSQAATASSGQTTSASTGGSSETGYYFHLMIEDSSGNQSTVSSTLFTTADVTAPSISGVSVGSETSVGAILTFTSDEAGTAYWMVDSNATRTAAQVKSGGGIDSDSQAATASSGQTTAASTGGSASTGYYFHLMIEDSSGNQSTVSSMSFTTASASATNLMPSGSTNAFDVYPPWTNAGTGPTVTANTTSNPRGSGTNADTIEDTNASSQSGRACNVTLPADTLDYLAQVDALKGTSNPSDLVMLSWGNATANRAVFNLTSGTVEDNQLGASVSITSLGGGWYTLAVSLTNDNSTSKAFKVYPACTDVYDASKTGSAIFANPMVSQKSGTTPSTYVDP